MLDIGRAVENAQWLLLLQKQQCLVLERTGFGIFCRNDMSKMQTFWRSQHPPPIIYWGGLYFGKPHGTMYSCVDVGAVSC